MASARWAAHAVPGSARELTGRPPYCTMVGHKQNERSLGKCNSQAGLLVVGARVGPLHLLGLHIVHSFAASGRQRGRLACGAEGASTGSRDRTATANGQRPATASNGQQRPATASNGQQRPAGQLEKGRAHGHVQSGTATRTAPHRMRGIRPTRHEPPTTNRRLAVRGGPTAAPVTVYSATMPPSRWKLTWQCSIQEPGASGCMLTEYVWAGMPVN